MTDSRAAARAWLADDPDPRTRAELADLLARADARGGEDRELAERMRPLRFGTAGLRAPLGAGPARMNRAVVIRTTAGLAAYLRERHAGAAPAVVLGHDARHQSAEFAIDAATVLRGAGLTVRPLPAHSPTPVLAFAVRRTGAAAGVMLTASHNPPSDNGYKVYLDRGLPVAPPEDARIAERVAGASSAAAILGGCPDTAAGTTGADRTADAGTDLLAAYLDEAVQVLSPDGAREVATIYTALHGIGAATFRRAWGRAGFPPLIEVAEQAEPDPRFPTVPAPNPEEAGALDRAFALAQRREADLILAHDPDADRCAVAVPDPAGSGWRRLSGDEVGILLADHLLRHDRIPPGGVLATTIVSSPMLAALARAASRPFAQTLTGFKWLVRVPCLAFAYEEALGYCLAPGVVPDKDGITAALLVAEIAAEARRDGRRLPDLLDDLTRRLGAYRGSTAAIPCASAEQAAGVCDRLLQANLRTVGGCRVLHVADLRRGIETPPTLGVRLTASDPSGRRLRAVLRPSGTEPKLKLYLHAWTPGPAPDPTAAHAGLDARLHSAREQLETHITSMIRAVCLDQ